MIRKISGEQTAKNELIKYTKTSWVIRQEKVRAINCKKERIMVSRCLSTVWNSELSF